VEIDGSAVRVRQEPTAPGKRLTITPVGNVPAFDVKVRRPATLSPDAAKLRARAPLFVVADAHGEFEILVELLRAHNIVDSSLHWSFGRGQLVFLGDVFDRGPNHTEILWLIYELEAQARAAGGTVHLLLGNHEVMVLRGDLRYLHPKYPRVAQQLKMRSYDELFSSRSVLGQWLRTKAAVMKLGDLLLMHGGISPEIVDKGLQLRELNAGVRAAINGAAVDDLILGKMGPLWYRGYFPNLKEYTRVTPEDVGRVCEHFGVKKILVGHTIVPTVTVLYEGRVIAVQVYPRREESSGRAIMEALLVRGRNYYRAAADGSLSELSAAHDLPTVARGTYVRSQARSGAAGSRPRSR
jgi:hypothetical protein